MQRKLSSCHVPSLVHQHLQINILAIRTTTSRRISQREIFVLALSLRYFYINYLGAWPTNQEKQKMKHIRNWISILENWECEMIYTETPCVIPDAFNCQLQSICSSAFSHWDFCIFTCKYVIVDSLELTLQFLSTGLYPYWIKCSNKKLQTAEAFLKIKSTMIYWNANIWSTRSSL